eukprot:GHVP01061764.1.p1 GENE.GHVP01061764.1~~GHVP01061764.1.p1  ORF type:complete len:237 (+),score=46.31 GHVP01061764.1:80-712(+)
MREPIKARLILKIGEEIPKRDQIIPEDVEFILRLPQSVSSSVREHMDLFPDNSPPVEIDFIDNRTAKVSVLDTIMEGVLVDLPCIVEYMRTEDTSLYHKAADISQMLLVYDNSQDSIKMVEELKRNDYKYKDGLSKSLKDVYSLYNTETSLHVERAHEEVKRLLKADRKAGFISYSIIDDEDLVSQEIDETAENKAKNFEMQISQMLDLD